MARKKHYRVYLDAFRDGEPVWNIDEGDATTAKSYAHVFLDGVSAADGSNMDADNELEPKCWFRVIGVLTASGNTATIRRN